MLQVYYLNNKNYNVKNIWIKNKILDPEAYDVFAELFHPVIAEYHKVDVATLKSVHDLGNADQLRDLPQNYQDAIVSTRVRVGRTVRGYPMAGKLTKEVT